jgi:hypothetical protein
MRIHVVSWLLSAVAVESAASSARVVLLQSPSTSTSSSSPDTVSPKIARLIFAQRLALSDDLTIAASEPAEILQVDRYGGPQQRPMVAPVISGSRLLVVVDGVEPLEALAPTGSGLTAFDIVPAPHPKDTEDLIAELSTQIINESEDATADYELPTFAKDFAKWSGASLHGRRGRYIIHVSSISVSVVVASGGHGLRLSNIDIAIIPRVWQEELPGQP